MNRLPLNLLGVLLLAANAVSAGEVYRYLNDKGVVVIDEKVPPEFVRNGYDVLDSTNMALIRRVPKYLTDQELQERGSDAAKVQLREEEERRLKAWDESLLLRYSSIEDIAAARDRTVKDLQIRIAILKSNLSTIKSQIEREQQKAADFERRGVEAPDDLLKNIDIMRLEIEDTEQSIEVRREEIAGVKSSFQRDIDRFSTLLDRVQIRHQGAASPRPEPAKRY